MKTTPDLSQEFHPVPKPLPKGKKPKKGLISAGKKTLAWNEDRQDLKVVFKDQGITECEIKGKKCTPKNFLGFAHTRRRNKLTEEQIKDPHFVVLACQQDHYEVDFVMPKIEAETLLDNIVKSRGW
jgi:hypothetical protein